MTPGDIFVVKSTHPFDRLIRSAQHRKFPALDSSWTHCGVIVDDCGGTVEAVWNGVEYGNIRNYPSARTFSVMDMSLNGQHIVNPLTARLNLVSWAERRVGLRYGFATIASIATSVAFNLPYKFEHDRTYICSGLVACDIDALGVDLGDDPQWTMPAQIAAWGNVA